MIGIYGGSFNPVHIGHLIVAEDLVANGKVREVYFLPCYSQPLKQNYELMDFDVRCRLILDAISDTSYFHLLDIEQHLPKPNYTYNTLVEIRKRVFPPFCFIMGADNLHIIKSWYKYEELFREFKILVIARPGFKIPDDYSQIGQEEIIPTRLVDISSTEIRERMKNGLPCRYLKGYCRD